MRLLRPLSKCIVALALVGASSAFAQVGASTPWQTVTTSNGSSATARHEAHAVSANGKIYLMGGRGQRPVEVYDPVTNSWRNLGSAPLEIHHFQPVVVGTKIYAIAAFTCCYPDEPSIADIHVFDTVSEQWTTQGTMPANRVRGAAAAVVWQGDIYVLGGNTQGHSGGAVAWLDRYDPQSGNWQVLADAPAARDHFAAVVVDGQLVAAGGRTTEFPNSFANTVAATNIYDFSTGAWRVGANIPNPRAGTVAVGAGDELIIAGGESNTQGASFAATHAYNVNTNQWRTLQPLLTARHSGGAAVIGTKWHVIAGNLVRGGGAETNVHETLELNVEQDQDNDGLSDSEEAASNTDVALSDTDGDGASDGDEVDAGSNPLVTDSDGDGLSDGDELNTHSTNPMLADTDGDTLSDANELASGTDPLKSDTDDDGLSDQVDPNPLTPEEPTQPVDPDPVDPDPVTPDPVDPDPVVPDPVEPDPVDPNPVDPDPVEPTPTNLVQTGGSGGGAMFWIILLMGVGILSRNRR